MTDETHQHFIDVLQHFRTAMLITHASDDRLHARPMAVADVQASGEIYFATGTDTPKASEVAADSRVSVTLQDDARFAALSGTAQLVRDRALIDKLWSEAWRVWWPQGKEDPSIVLIRVTVEDGEYWDNAGAQGLKYALRAAKAYASGKRPEVDPGQHGRTDH